jgi:hypothetical protein
VRAQELAGVQDGVLTLQQAQQLGATTSQVNVLVQGRQWARPIPRVYQPPPMAALTRRGRIRAAVVSCGDSAVAALHSAAELHGIAVPFDPFVHVAVAPAASRTRPRQPWLRIHQYELRTSERACIDGVPTTSIDRTLTDLICRRPRFDAVALLDSALGSGATEPADLYLRLAPALRRRRGAIAARRYLVECDGRAQSPLETCVRLRCVDGGVPPEALQYPVTNGQGEVLGYADLAWPSRRLAVEADGRGPHANPEALFVDRRRQNDFHRAGWRVFRFTWDDCRHPAYIPNMLRTALSNLSHAA